MDKLLISAALAVVPAVISLASLSLAAHWRKKYLSAQEDATGAREAWECEDKAHAETTRLYRCIAKQTDKNVRELVQERSEKLALANKYAALVAQLAAWNAANPTRQFREPIEAASASYIRVGKAFRRFAP